MPPNPRQLAGEAAKLFDSLTAKLKERTGPLSPEAVESLKRLSPDEQVALDEFLSAGGQVGEVSGTAAESDAGGGTRAGNIIWPKFDQMTGERMDPTKPESLGSVALPSGNSYWSLHRDVNMVAAGQQVPPDPPVTGPFWSEEVRVENAEIATDIAYLSNARQNEAAKFTTGGKSPVWPEAWYKIENIPGIAGGLTVGGLLASQRAEAATKQEEFSTLQSKARPLTQQELAAQQARAKAQAEANRKSPNRKVRGAQLLKDAADGNLQMADSPFALIEKFDAHVIKPIMHFTQFAWQNALYGGPSPELQQAIARDAGAEKTFAPSYVPYDPEKPGNIFRQVQPEKALMFERLFKHVIGPTDWNTGDPSLTLGNIVPGMKPGKEAEGNVERLSPAARAVIDRMGERHGMAATAGLLSLTQWGRDLPFWLLPASDAKGTIASQAALGTLSGMADPESTASLGAVAGAAFGVAGKAVGALLKKMAGGPKVDVVSVMDPEGSAKLIESMARSISGEHPLPFTTGRHQTPLAVAELPGGKMGALVQDQKGIVDIVPFKGKVPAGVPHLLEDGRRIVNGEVSDSVGLAVIAKDGKLQIHHADSDDLAAELFKARRPVEVTLPDGTTKYGFIVSPEGEAVRVGLAPGERLPGGIDGEALVDSKSVRLLEDREAVGLARLQSEQMFDEQIIGGALNEDPGKLAKILQAAHSESGLSVIPTKVGPAGQALPPSQVVIDAEFSVMHGGGVPPGRALPAGPLPDADPKMLPANAGPTGKFIPSPSSSWTRNVWGMFIRGAKLTGDKLLHPVHTLPDELREAAMRQASLHTFEELRQPLHDSIIAKIGGFKKMSPVEKRQTLALINQFLNGTLSPDGMKQLPGMSAELVKYLELRENQLRANEQIIDDLRMLNLKHRTDPEAALRGAELPAEAQAYWRRIVQSGGKTPDYIKTSVVERQGKNGQKLLEYKFIYDSPAGGDWTPPKPGEAMPNEFYKWAPNIYLSKMLPEGEWAKVYKKDARRYHEARAELFKLLKAENKDWDDTALWAHAERWLEDLIAGGEGSIAASSSLRPRLKDMPLWLRDALGEINNGAIRLADAEARQQVLIHRGLIYKAISENPALSVRPSSFDLELQRMGWKKLEGNYGLATGMLVRPDVYEVLHNLPDSMAHTRTFWSKLTGIAKWNFTVGNPATWALNIGGNFQNVVGSNLVNPLNPLDAPVIAWAGREAVRDLMGQKSASKASPVLRADKRAKRALRAMELGILGSDASNADFRTSIREWHTLLQKEVGDRSIFDVATDIPMAGVNKLSKLYGSIDTLAKYSTWVGGLKKWGVDGELVDRKKAIKAMKDNGLLDGWLGTLNEKQKVSLLNGEYTKLLPNSRIRSILEVEAAKRIHASFPMVDRLGQYPAAVARAPTAMLATNAFFRTGSEMLRVWGSYPKRLVSEPGFLKSALYTLGFVGATAAFIKYARSAQGIDEDYIDAVWQSATPVQRKFRPGAMALPYRNPDGSMDFIDFTKFVEPLRYLIGSPEDNPVKRVAVNVATLPIGGSLADSLLREGAYSQGWLDDKPFITDPAEWERATGSGMLSDAARMGVIPGVFSSTYRAMERGGIGFEARTSAGMPEVEPQPKWMSAINAVMGGDFLMRVGTPSQVTRARIALAYEIDKINRQLYAVHAKTEGQSTGPLTMPLDKAEAIRVQEAILEEKLVAFHAALEQLDKIGPGGRPPTRPSSGPQLPAPPPRPPPPQMPPPPVRPPVPAPPPLPSYPSR